MWMSSLVLNIPIIEVPNFDPYPYGKNMEHLSMIVNEWAYKLMIVPIDEKYIPILWGDI